MGLKILRCENINLTGALICGVIALNIASFTGPKSLFPNLRFPVASTNFASFSAALTPFVPFASSRSLALLRSIMPSIANLPFVPGTGASTMPPPSSITSFGRTPLSLRYFTISGTSFPAISSLDEDTIYKSCKNVNPSFRRLSTLSKIAARLPLVSTAPRP